MRTEPSWSANPITSGSWVSRFRRSLGQGRSRDHAGSYDIVSPLDGIRRIVGFVPPAVGPGHLYVGVGVSHAAAFAALNRATWWGAGGCRLAVRNRGALPAGYDPVARAGFGLRMVLMMCKQLNGRLEAASLAGETEFAVTFALRLDQPPVLKVVDSDGEHRSRA